MAERHDAKTIIAIAVVASATATFLHEGVGHGLTAWLRGDIPTELTSNHLSAVRPDRLVSAGGTLVNLLAGLCAYLASRKTAGSNIRYFLWLFSGFNLLAGSGYFLFSGVLGLGDWSDVIAGMSNQTLLRIGMAVFGAALYFIVVRLLAFGVGPFCPTRGQYNVVGRLPYIAACLFSCVAGSLDPMGVRLFFLSTAPAAFGGYSGLLWADCLMPHDAGTKRFVERSPAWWIAALLLGGAYIAILGRGVHFVH
jgi:hypothetical protein